MNTIGLSKEGSMLTPAAARQMGVCRICLEPIPMQVFNGSPRGWYEEFGRMVFPYPVTLNFGEEFAHTKCYEEKKNAVQIQANDGGSQPVSREDSSRAGD